MWRKITNKCTKKTANFEIFESALCPLYEIWEFAFNPNLAIK